MINKLKKNLFYTKFLIKNFNATIIFGLLFYIYLLNILNAQDFNKFIIYSLVLLFGYYFIGNIIYFLLFILILSFPIVTIYQKYFDPLFFFFFFGLIKSNQITQFLNDNSKSLKILYTYFLSFYLFSLIYYL